MSLAISVKLNELAFTKTNFCNPGGNLWAQNQKKTCSEKQESYVNEQIWEMNKSQ